MYLVVLTTRSTLCMRPYTSICIIHKVLRHISDSERNEKCIDLTMTNDFQFLVSGNESYILGVLGRSFFI